MKKVVGKLWKTALFAAAVLILVGCATRVRFEAPRPPNLDTSGFQRVAVVPFTTTALGGEAIARALTSEVTDQFRNIGQFSLVSYDTVRAARIRGESMESYADALFRGRVTYFMSRTTPRQGTRTVRRDNVNVQETYTFHYREVEVRFEYYFVRTRDGTMVGPIRRTARRSARNENLNELPAAITLASAVATWQLREPHFRRDVAPHVVSITRVMEREPNSDLRGMMNDADAFRRAGNYVLAREAYIAIWDDYQSIAAAINAAILFETTGDLEDAIYLMENVFEATRAPRVIRKLSQLNREAAYALGLEAFDETQTPAERVAGHAVAEISGILPEIPRLWIHTTADLALVNDVIDNMTSTFLGSGFTIVDRQMIDMILAEQDLHLGGAVADSDFMRVGNLAGANTIVIVGMSGTGAARRLQVRVLDIETAALRMQSGTGVAWRL